MPETEVRKVVENELAAILEGVRAQVEQCVRLHVHFRQLTKNTTAPRVRRTFEFPGMGLQDSTTFVVLLRVCSIVLENMRRAKIVPVRDIFYQDVELFKTQKVVVSAVERLSVMFRVPREILNVTQSPNGLVAADMTIALKNGAVHEVRRSNGIALVPVAPILHVRCAQTPRYVLVVEKEAVFSHLAAELTDGVLLTGKGFPDHATRRLLSAVITTYPEVPVFGLVDSDPHGILILRTYDQGPRQEFDYTRPLQVTYLGVSLLDHEGGLVPTTLNDVRVARSTLRKDWIHQPQYVLHKRELQRGLFVGMKGEMNILERSDTQRLVEYVRRKMKRYSEFVESRAKRIRYVNADPQHQIATQGAAEPAPGGSKASEEDRSWSDESGHAMPEESDETQVSD